MFTSQNYISFIENPAAEPAVYTKDGGPEVSDVKTGSDFWAPGLTLGRKMEQLVNLHS